MRRDGRSRKGEGEGLIGDGSVSITIAVHKQTRTLVTCRRVFDDDSGAQTVPDVIDMR